MKANIEELFTGETAADVISGLTRTRILSNAIMAAAELGVADRLSGGAQPIDELATEMGVDSASLLRLLRFLAMTGIFKEVEPMCFAQSELSEALRSDSPDSVRDSVLMDASAWFRETTDKLTESVQTGRPRFEDFYGYMSTHPEDAAVLNAGMAAATRRELRVLDQIDLSWADTIADVGGGNGAFLSAILRRYPDKQGILADLPEVAEEARQTLGTERLLDRCQIVGVDVLQGLPFRADALILKRVVMDWSDEDAGRILRNCRAALSESGRLLIMETTASTLMGALQNAMLVLFVGGGARTEEDFTRLLHEADMRMARFQPTASGFSVIEARI